MIGCFLLNEAEVLAATYFDTCVIERISDIENVESGITEQVYFPIHDGKLPCALSRKYGKLTCNRKQRSV